jgi:hypothetical protein
MRAGVIGGGTRTVLLRGRVAVVLCLLALGGGALAGCGDDPPTRKGPEARSVAVPARGTDRPAASAAGGACQLLDFDAVAQFVGVTFQVAATAQKDATATCVLQRGGVGYPDLTLAVTPTTVPASAFRATAAPPGAVDVAALGQAAYQLVRPAPGTDPAGPGPAVEIGWLSRKGQLMVVRYRLAGDRPQTEAQTLAPQVVELARYLDLA